MPTSIIVPSGTVTQRSLVNEAIAMCRFDWTLLTLGLRWHLGRTTIPVEWGDLSRYGASASWVEATDEHANDDDGHADHEHTEHIDVHEGTDTGHVLLDNARAQVLGLAWYSGKVSLDLTLADDPPLAHEVFLSEVAHMVDFFYMTPWMRETVYRAFHDFEDVPHNHGWFEEGGNQNYWEMVGESFMGGWVMAYSDMTPTLTGFTHVPTPQTAEIIRETLVPPYNGRTTGAYFHQRHNGVPYEKGWADLAAAKASGRTACPICLPGVA